MYDIIYICIYIYTYIMYIYNKELHGFTHMV